MSSDNFLLDAIHLALGARRGYSIVNKFGRNTAVGTTYTPVSGGGVYRTPQASGATALRIKAGGHLNDDAAGSGARAITLYGLDENFDYAEEILDTAGASVSSPSVTTFTRLFRARVTASGTYATATAGSHSGAIVIEDAAGTEDWATIVINGFPRATTDIASYSVARGHVALVRHIDLFSDSSKLTEALFFIRHRIDDTSPPYAPMRVITDFTSNGGHIEHSFGGGLIVCTGPCDVGFLAKVDVGTALVTASFEHTLVNLSQAA